MHGTDWTVAIAILVGPIALGILVWLMLGLTGLVSGMVRSVRNWYRRRHNLRLIGQRIEPKIGP